MRQVVMQIRVRDVLIAVAIIGLLLGHLTHLLRTDRRRARVTIRVFNQTSEDIGFLRYEWDTVAGLVESHGENSGTVAITPGGQESFRVDLPGAVDLVLTCTTPGGHMTSGPVRIGGDGGRAGSVDFYVRPNGMRVGGMTRSTNQARPGAARRQ